MANHPNLRRRPVTDAEVLNGELRTALRALAAAHALIDKVPDGSVDGSVIDHLRRAIDSIEFERPFPETHEISPSEFRARLIAACNADKMSETARLMATCFSGPLFQSQDGS